MSKKKRRHRRTIISDIAIANARLIVALESAEQAIEKLAFAGRRAMAVEPGISVEAGHVVRQYAQRDLGRLRLLVQEFMGSVRTANDKRESRHG